MKWIKCNNEMPPNRIDVFVYNKQEDRIYMDYYTHDDNPLSSFSGWYRSNLNHITHWMMPEKPASF